MLLKHLMKAWLNEATEHHYSRVLLPIIDCIDALDDHSLEACELAMTKLVPEAMRLLIDLSIESAISYNEAIDAHVVYYKSHMMTREGMITEAMCLAKVRTMLRFPTYFSPLTFNDDMCGRYFSTDYLSGIGRKLETLNAILPTRHLYVPEDSAEYFKVLEEYTNKVEGTVIANVIIADSTACCINDDPPLYERGVLHQHGACHLLTCVRRNPNLMQRARSMMLFVLKEPVCRGRIAERLKIRDLRRISFGDLMVECSIKMSNSLCTIMKSGNMDDYDVVSTCMREAWDRDYARRSVDVVKSVTKVASPPKAKRNKKKTNGAKIDATELDHVRAIAQLTDKIVDDNHNGECMICFDDLQDKGIVFLTCRPHAPYHVMCDACWPACNDTCPVCDVRAVGVPSASFLALEKSTGAKKNVSKK